MIHSLDGNSILSRNWERLFMERDTQFIQKEIDNLVLIMIEHLEKV
jgi:hypothetical protein